ncbi:hypothetical protein DYBT9275_06031 [Dyadobacter sp. CECT 9275]|uniref:Uncharacterized protein n=1 Tax=Dyadobacter helix TaxID=2822344 RepID=A0A916JHC1_9BACT|nr:hypothetical protein [Dyadobacter sp. CECT 9275]CAG5018585.1 hypothetical protein DYBT9275_06031 [Dyadobacter sp. CECT 9275]
MTNRTLKDESEKGKNSRRNFLQNGLLATSAFALTPYITSAETAQQLAKSSKCLDYGKSFVCNTGDMNSVRMWIESRTVITDTQTGKTIEYFQGGACKSEDTFAAKNLFYQDNYDFTPIFGDGKVLVFRRHVNERKGYRSIKTMGNMWGSDPIIRLPAAPVITELDTWEKINKATMAGIPIVTQTVITNKETGMSAMIECPCKTININRAKKLYQTDTGPVVLPDLTKKYDELMDSLRLAYIAFNAPDFADFVVEVPTPVLEKGKQVASVYHFSEVMSFTSQNKLFALGKI